jgi:hypothetical protein
MQAFIMNQFAELIKKFRKRDDDFFDNPFAII